LAGSTVTNTGPTTIGGNLGVSPGTAITGFPPGIVTGTIYSAGAVAGTAQSDLTTAYSTLAGLPFNTDLTGQDLGGLTLFPGVYHFDSSAFLDGTLTLDAQGSNDAVWVFQMGSTLIAGITSPAVVQVINGGPDDGLYWQVGSSATLYSDTVFEGNILASASITLDTGAIIPCGRALAENAAVTLDTNVISTACTYVSGWSASQATELSGVSGTLGTGLDNPTYVPEPSALLLLATCIAGLAIQQKWARSKAAKSRSL
jgi:type VI secretion system secreted protein VgrG